MPTKELFREVETHMKHAVDHFHGELKHLRTGRASLSLLEGLTVDYYGSQVPLNQVANLSVADASLIVAQPYDPSQSSAIERAIMKSDLGLNPSSDGNVIRIPVPALTEERRKEFVKLVKRHAEEARVAIRNIRRDEVDHVKRMEKDGEAGTDEIDRGLAAIQKITDRFIARVEEIAHRKEADILEV